jgi:hypothetical protein
MAKCSDSSSSAAASIPQSSGIDFTLELPPVPWRDNESNVGYHNDNESVTRSAEHDPPSRDLVHSRMGSRHPSNSYGRPSNSVGDFFDRGDVGQVPGMGWVQHDPVGNQSDGGLSIFERPGGMGWEAHGNQSDGRLAPHWQEDAGLDHPTQWP